MVLVQEARYGQYTALRSAFDAGMQQTAQGDRMAKRAPSRRRQQATRELAGRLRAELEKQGKRPRWLYLALKGPQKRGPVSYKTVLSYARGDTEPHAGMLQEVARVLGVPYATLLPGAGPGVEDDATTRRQFEARRTQQLAEKRAEIHALQEQLKGKEMSDADHKKFLEMQLDKDHPLPTPEEAKRWADFTRLSTLVLEAQALRAAVPLGEVKLTREQEQAEADRARHEQRVRAAFARAFPAAYDDESLWEAAAGPWRSACWRFAPPPKAKEPVPIGPAAELAAARAVGQAIAAPLKALRVDPRRISPWQLGQYVQLVSCALETVLVGAPEIQFRRKLVTVGKPRGRARRQSAPRLR